MDERAGPLAEMLRLNTRLLLNCIDGVSEEEASARAAGGTNSIDEIESLPSLAAMREAGSAVLGVLTFLAQHDSYHVGQLSLLRRQLGLPAMKYG
jgi:uncharacterized damage-inducible protein DinB